MKTASNGDQTIRKILGSHFPLAVIDSWEAQGVTNLLPIQLKAVEAGCLSGSSCLVVAPTSSGKTFIGEIVSLIQVLALRRAIYLVPFKALAEEKFADFRRKYSHAAIGAKILLSTGDRRAQDRQLLEGEFDVAILTYEKLSALLVTSPTMLSVAGALIVDEVQMIADQTRGPELEMLLTRAKQVAPELQVVALSAVASDLNGMDAWLEMKLVADDHRPVKLREGVVTPDGTFEYIEWADSNHNAGTEKLATLDGNIEDELAVSLIKGLLENQDAQVLAFVSSVDRTRKIAERIAGALALLAPSKHAKELISALEESESVEALLKGLDHSVAFHNADLTIEERLAVEAGFRSGEIRCLVSTSTLSMGVNLPASAVVIIDHQKWTKASGAWVQEQISIAEYRNMSGRAGRFGIRKDELGYSFLIATSPIEAQALLKGFVGGKPAPLESALLKQPLGIRLLRIIASGLCDTKKAILHFLLRTFAARHSWASDESKEELVHQIEASVHNLIQHGLILDDDARLQATPLGRICAASGLRIETFGELVSLVSRKNTSPLDITMVAARGEDTGTNAISLRLSTEEHRLRTPYIIQELIKLCDTITSPLTRRLLDAVSAEFRPDYEVSRGLKFQAVAMAFVKGIPSRTIENQLGTSAGRARNIGSNCSWLCDVAAKIAWITGRDDEGRAFERLSERFSYGCTDEALVLAQIPYRMHRGEREAIVTAGYGSLQLIVDTPSEEIARTAKVSRGRVQGLQRKIVEILGPTLDLQRAQAVRLRACGQNTGLIETLYATKGKLLEQAIADVLSPPFCTLTVTRIGSQNEGEADLRFMLGDGGNGIAQVTAKDNPSDKVGLVKACSVLQQSPELSPRLFICFGRPDFDEKAIRKAAAHVSTGKNFKLIPVSTLAEMFVRFKEGSLTTAQTDQVLEERAGYIGLTELAILQRKAISPAPGPTEAPLKAVAGK